MVPTKSGRQHLEFYIKSHGGLTARLPNMGNTKVKVLLDGPYGTVSGSNAEYDKALLIAGGSGGSFILPILQDLARDNREGQEIVVVFAARSTGEGSLGLESETRSDISSRLCSMVQRRSFSSRFKR